MSRIERSKPVQKIMGLTKEEPLFLQTLHQADAAPFLFETRWINIDAVPKVLDADFTHISANEWLVENALFTTGEITFSAANASKAEAKILKITEGTAIFIVDRITWNGPNVITVVRLAYAPPFKMSTEI